MAYKTLARVDPASLIFTFFIEDWRSLELSDLFDMIIWTIYDDFKNGVSGLANFFSKITVDPTFSRANLEKITEKILITLKLCLNCS